MPPLLADFIYSSDCKLICEKSLTLPAGEEGFLLVVQGAEELFLVAAEQAEGFRVLTAGRAAVLRRLDIAVPELLQDTRVFPFLHLVFSKNVRHTEVPNGVVMV